MSPELSADFRVRLKQEMALWVGEGIINEQTAGILNARYQLDDIKKESSRLLAAVIFTVGGLLLGGGLISFVAANWEQIPTAVKVTLLLSLMLAFYGAGYWLWQEKGMPRLGHALVFTGCLVFGANIGLMAQIFNISGDWYGGFGAWALGALVMAWAAQSWITGALALAASSLWFVGYSHDHPQSWVAMMPLVIIALVLPLAWRIGSRALYALCFVALTFMLCNLTTLPGGTSQLMPATMAVGGFLAWTAGEFHRARRIRPAFGPPIAAIGMLTLAGCAYIWSFHWWWNEGNWFIGSRRESLPFLWAAPVIITALVALALAALVLRDANIDASRRLLMIGVVAASLILILCAVNGARGIGDQVISTVGVNLAALVIALVAIGVGLMDERRLAFWAGSLYLVVLILSRFLEYETSLLLKSAAFTACGLAMIAAGLAFEKRLNRKEAM
ncbi:MAG: DUF2157 domain-containing protein [Blastocatellia bacterium]